MTIETVLEIFFFVKGQYDNYKSNTKEKSLIIKRVLVLEDPLLRIQSKELEIPATSIDTLKEVLDFVKDFLHEYNNTSMWKSVIRAVRSGKYAADFHQCNVMIDRALATVNLSLNISNEERRQQDSESMKEFITSLCSHVISDTRAHGSVGNKEEKQRCEEILLEVKALSMERESIMKTFLETLGHTSFHFSQEEKADFVAMHEEVEDLINAGIDRLAASIDDVKVGQDQIEDKLDIIYREVKKLESSSMEKGNRLVRTVFQELFAKQVVKQRLKLILLGASGVGKTSICRRFGQGTFDSSPLPTTGIDYHIHSDEYLSYHIWDSAGQEAFEKTTKSFMKNVDATLLVYDITDKDSFETCKYWFEEVRRNDPNQLVFVIGNKVDLEDRRRIDKSEVERFCSENRVRHYEVSAKVDANISECMVTVVMSTVFGTNALRESRSKETIQLHKPLGRRPLCC